MGDRLLAVEQLLGNRLAVDREQDGLTHTLVRQKRIVEHGIDMLVDQGRLVDDVVLVLVALLESQRLVERQAKFTQDVIDITGQQVGFKRSRILDNLDDDALEVRLLSGPRRVPLQDDSAARDGLDDAERAEGEAGIGRVGVIGGLVAILRRIGVEDRLLDVRRQNIETETVVVERHPVDRQREAPIVPGIELDDPLVGL